jgi:hypothetical protein
MANAIQAAYKSYDPEPVSVPTLAICSVPKSADDLMRRGSSDRLSFPGLVTRTPDDAALRERVEKLSLLSRERVQQHEQWFEAFAHWGRLVDLAGTHDLIVSNPAKFSSKSRHSCRPFRKNRDCGKRISRRRIVEVRWHHLDRPG